MRLKKTFLALLVLVFTASAAAQFGTDLGGETLADSFVNFMDAITFANIFSVAAAVQFLVVVGLFYYAELNIIEQVFLRLEDIISDVFEGGDRLFRSDDSQYPTGTKGLSLAIAFLSANGVTGLFGLIAGIGMGLASAGMIFILHLAFLRATTDRVNEQLPGGLTGRTERDTRTAPAPGNRPEPNQDSPLSSDEIQFIMQVLNREEPRIDRMEDIEEEKLQHIQSFNRDIEKDINSAENSLENSKGYIEDRLTRNSNQNIPDDRMDSYFENPQNLSDDLNSNLSLSVSGRTRSRLKNKKDSLEDLIKDLEGEKSISEDADAALREIKDKNRRLLDRFEQNIINEIESNVGYGDGIEDILNAFNNMAVWQRAGFDNPQRDRFKNARELSQNLLNEYEKFQEIEKADDRMTGIVEDQIVPELNELISAAEKQILLIDIMTGNNSGNSNNGGSGNNEWGAGNRLRNYYSEDGNWWKYSSGNPPSGSKRWEILIAVDPRKEDKAQRIVNIISQMLPSEGQTHEISLDYETFRRQSGDAKGVLFRCLPTKDGRGSSNTGNTENLVKEIMQVFSREGVLKADFAPNISNISEVLTSSGGQTCIFLKKPDNISEDQIDLNLRNNNS